MQRSSLAGGRGQSSKGSLDFLKPQVAAAWLKAPPEKLAELCLPPSANKWVNAIYKIAFLEGRNVAIQHPCHTLKEAGGGNPEEINWRAWCYKCHPPARGGMKELAQETEATINSIWAMAQSAPPVEGAMEKITHSLDELERHHGILSSRRAVTELHHPLHKQGKVIGCEGCGTMPYQDAIFLFARRYWNCLDYEWVRIALNKWRKKEERILMGRFFKEFEQIPRVPAESIRALKGWQRVESIRRREGRTLQGALRETARHLDWKPRTVENAYYNGLRLFAEFVAWSNAAAAENHEEKMEKARIEVILQAT